MAKITIRDITAVSIQGWCDLDELKDKDCKLIVAYGDIVYQDIDKTIISCLGEEDRATHGSVIIIPTGAIVKTEEV